MCPQTLPPLLRSTSCVPRGPQRANLCLPTKRVCSVSGRAEQWYADNLTFYPALFATSQYRPRAVTN